MSQALVSFWEQMRRADALSDAIVLRGKSLSERQVFYHVDVAARVASWDSYLNKIVEEALNRVGDPFNVEVISLKSLVLSHAEILVDKFNTPNFENSRNLLIRSVGFDPIAVWNWPLRNMTWQMTSQRLNEILKIRHSFAHGSALPRYPWLPQRRGEVYLNKKILNDITRLLEHLAVSTDVNLDIYLRATYRTVNPPRW